MSPQLFLASQSPEASCGHREMPNQGRHACANHKPERRALASSTANADHWSERNRNDPPTSPRRQPKRGFRQSVRKDWTKASSTRPQPFLGPDYGVDRPTQRSAMRPPTDSVGAGARNNANTLGGVPSLGAVPPSRAIPPAECL